MPERSSRVPSSMAPTLVPLDTSSSSPPTFPRGESYRPLPTPLASHPGLNSYGSTSATSYEAAASASASASASIHNGSDRPQSSTVLASERSYRPPRPSTGALSTISSLLLGDHPHRHGHSRSSPTSIPNQSAVPDRARSDPGSASTSSSSSLLLRRGKQDLSEQFSLGHPLDSFNCRYGGDKQIDTSADDLGDIPPLPKSALVSDSSARGARQRRASSRTLSMGPETTHELPPSPVGLPGAWFDDINATHSALLLPPPFLDDSSSRQSFEGLLGTREAKLRQARLRKEMRNYAKDRPPRPAFPQSLLSTASKLVTALGPPGGVDSGSYYRAWKDDPIDPTPGSVRKERRRVQRANSAMKGLEVGEKYARKLAERLMAERSRYTDGSLDAEANKGDVDHIEPQVDGPAAELFAGRMFVAATPMSLLQGSPGSHLSPPLFGIATPALSESVSKRSATQDAEAPHEPPKAFLHPNFDDTGEDMSPLPLLLDATHKSAPSSPLDYGFFAIRTRHNAGKAATSLAGSFWDATAAVEGTTDDGEIADLSSSGDASPKQLAVPAASFLLPKVDTRTRPMVDLLIWLLVGSPDVSGGFDQGLASVGGLLGTTLHLVGFAVFVLVHTWALGVSLCATLRSVALFSHWTFLNLTGRTDLSIVAREYFILCQKEWNLVSAEDGVKLSIGSVLLGLFELMAIQAISKERWIAEGPGKLVLVNGDEAARFAASADCSSLEASSSPIVGGGASPLLRRFSKSRSLVFNRPSVSRRGTSRRWTVDDGEGLIVTGGGDSILEGTIYNESVDPLAYASPSFTPHPGSATGANTGIPVLDELDDVPPLELGDALPGDTLPGFSFPPSPVSFLAASPKSPPTRPILDGPDESTAFVMLLRRHARLATASYGLHTYILAPPTPLFTPSGATLPHRVFSHLGGVDHKAVLHVAIQKHYTGIPAVAGDEADSIYEPQFYLLRDDLHGEVVCVVRGTQSLADIRTDLEAGLEPVELPSLDPSSRGTETFKAHAGILAAARRLLDPETSPLFTKLRKALEDHPGYSLVLTGHSLGAAIASTVAFLVGQYTPAEPESIGGPSVATHATYVLSDHEHDRGHWTVSPRCGLPAHRPVRAICFAHPATVDLPLAKRCSLGQTPLVLSVSLGPDAVCRMGIPQVRELRRVLGRLAKNRRKWLKLQKSAVEAGGRRSQSVSQVVPGTKRMQHGKSEILTAWWRWKKLQGGIRQIDLEAAKNGSHPVQLTKAELEERNKIEEKAWKWRCEMDGIEDDDVHPEGKDQKTLFTRMIPCGKAYHIDRLPVEMEWKRKQDTVAERERVQRQRDQQAEEMDQDQEDDEESQMWGLYEVAAPDAFYACPHLEADLVKSHLPKEYLDAVNSL
ncbi:BZ3500_MvSof-1268-A1-R1_Chr2-2g05082 [Microbotryum saponariae]|uniref:sn-1-specific diacylglycerol lipase n=1 Tax=Microbotryum saponariae TaxID=289078 RepID=A0A2X0KAS0_9BASI|nr:BZ3500_MvSof-1268-A1-R1_Chr2-2g05082 [Microbotryum saponariae]SDA00868.1 BZ3501_MvSof-1269-A2-R1_Chr2-2g04756 [Microbotryum saponariae]